MRVGAAAGTDVGAGAVSGLCTLLCEGLYMTPPARAPAPPLTGVITPPSPVPGFRMTLAPNWKDTPLIGGTAGWAEGGAGG
jgi:hypothetical protein